MASVGQIQIATPARFRRDVVIAIAAGVLVFGLMLTGGIGAALVAAVLLVVVGVGLAKPDIATVAVVFVIYADLAAVAVRSHGIPKLLTISFFLLLLLPVAYHVIVRHARLRTDAVLGMMLAYLAVQVASAVFARDVARSMQTIVSFATEGIAVYFLLLNAIRTPAILRRCLWMMLAAGMLLGSVSILQNRAHRYDSDFGGLALTRLVTTNSAPAISDDEGRDVDQETRPRALGPIGDANFYAQMMVVLLPIAVLRLWAERKRFPRRLALASLVPIIGGVVLTFSRGAAVAAVFFCCALLALRYLKLRHAVVPLIAVIIIVALTPAYVSRLSTLMKIDSPGMRSADSSIRERSTIYLSGIRIFLDHPLLGVGIGQAPEYLPEYSNYSGHSRLHRKMGPHNMYLESLAETGVLGFAALMAMITLVIRRMWRLRQYWKIRNPEYAHTATSLLLAIAVFLVTGLFLHLAYARYFWLLFAMAGAAHAVYSPLPEASPASAEEPRSANTVPTRPRYVPVAQRLFTE